MTKLTILDAIRRTSLLNGGRPLGKAQFESETGITRFDWFGVFWARWSDALREAGCPPDHAQVAPNGKAARALPPRHARHATGLRSSSL